MEPDSAASTPEQPWSAPIDYIRRLSKAGFGAYSVAGFRRAGAACAGRSAAPGAAPGCRQRRDGLLEDLDVVWRPLGVIQNGLRLRIGEQHFTRRRRCNSHIFWVEREHGKDLDLPSGAPTARCRTRPPPCSTAATQAPRSGRRRAAITRRADLAAVSGKVVISRSSGRASARAVARPIRWGPAISSAAVTVADDRSGGERCAYRAAAGQRACQRE